MLKEPSAAAEGDCLIYAASLLGGEEEHVPKGEVQKGGREAPPRSDERAGDQSIDFGCLNVYLLLSNFQQKTVSFEIVSCSLCST